MHRISKKLATPKSGIVAQEIGKTHQTVSVLDNSHDQGLERVPSDQIEENKISNYQKIAMFRNRGLL